MTSAEMRDLEELLALLTVRYGPVPEEALAEARSSWPDRAEGALR